MSKVRHAPISVVFKLVLYMPYFGVGVYPSMNPSRVQLRRYAIHGSLITLTPKHSLTMCSACTNAVFVSCADLHLLRGDRAEENDAFKKSRATDLQATPIVNEYLVGIATSEARDSAAPNRVRMTR